MEKIVGVLKPFVDATEMLSSRDASISMAIPFVTSIMTSLDVIGADTGVKTMKRKLKEAMEERFAGMEGNDHYAVATLLDCKYKKHFFRDPSTLDRAKNVIVDKIVQALQMDMTTEVKKRDYHTSSPRDLDIFGPEGVLMLAEGSIKTPSKGPKMSRSPRAGV